MRKLKTPANSNEFSATIGKNDPHESAKRHVSGQAVYVDDIPEPQNTLYAAVYLSPVASGAIQKIDVKEVKDSEGVIDVITANDVPGHIDIAPVFDGDPVLAHEEVKFQGQPIIAVLAKSTRLARQAANKAKVKVKESKPILDIQGALEQKQFVRPPHHMQQGNFEKAMQNCQIKLSGNINVGGQEHMYLEGQVALAIPGEEDRMHIYTSSQHPSEVQKLVAEVLDINLHKVTVDMRRMGGGFGGKETQAAQWACIAAIFARRNKCAIKMRLPRQQDMFATGKRHPFENHYEIGIDQNGQLQAANIDINGNCGHSADLSDAIVDRAMFHCDNSYYLGETKIVGHRCKTNQVSHTAFRGFGGPQGMLIAEAMIEKIARRVNKDPLAIRKINLYSESGPRNVTQYGMEVENNLLSEIVNQLEESSDYWNRKAEIKQFNKDNPILKKGLALTPVKFGISFTAKFLNQAGALVHVYTDGSIQVNHGGTEMGQGLHTKIQQIAANEFGLPVEMIEVTSTRTDKVPNTSPTAASSGTDLNGKAVQNACIAIKERLADFFAGLHEGTAEEVQFSGEKVRLQGVEVDFADLIQQAYMERISLSSTGYYRTPKIYYDRETGTGRPFFYFAKGAAVAEVTVDTLTGEHKVNRVDILHDVGNSINPAIDIGQIEGGFIQGMGWLTSEELVWDKSGKLLSNNPATYKIPAIGDTPEIFNVELFNRPNAEDSIYHSKAVGEPPLMLAMCVWCAIKDAVSSISDYQIDPDLHTPATPEAIVNAIEQLTQEGHCED